MTKTVPQLPPAWSKARLTEVSQINPANPVRLPLDSEIVSFVPMAAVEEMTGRLDRKRERVWGEVKKGYTRFQDGDVLFAKITPCMENGKVALANSLRGGVGAGSTEFHIVRPGPAIQCKFLFFVLLQERVRREARERMTGTAGQLRVPAAFLEDLLLALPPLREQERIVEALESHLSRLDGAVALLRRVRRNLKRYRAAVVKAAVEGRLVRTEAELACSEGRDYEPAAVLLGHILTERHRRWEQAELANVRKKGEVRRDLGRKQRYKQAVTPDVSALQALPAGWCWARLDSIAEVQLGQQRHPRYTSGGAKLPYIRAANITWKGLDLSHVRQMSFPNVERYRLEDGDVLLSEASGSPLEAGKPAVWRDEIPGACYQKTVLRVRGSDKGAILPEFLRLVFLRDCFTGTFARLAPGVGIVHITAERLNDWAIPLPPLNEQRRLIREVASIESHIDVVATEVEAQLRRLHGLRQALLDWALQGQLVEHEARDELASALLERIRTETAAATSRAPGGRVEGKRRGDRGRMSGPGTEEARC